MSGSNSDNTNSAYETKEENKKSKSNFLYSFSLLSKEKNDAINTIYAFCRKTDDIVDNENESADVKFKELTDWKNELGVAIETGNSKHNLLNKIFPMNPFLN